MSDSQRWTASAAVDQPPTSALRIAGTVVVAVLGLGLGAIVGLVVGIATGLIPFSVC